MAPSNMKPVPSKASMPCKILTTSWAWSNSSQQMKSEYVFPSDSATGHLGTLKKSWAKLLQRAGIENAVPHDLRRSVAQAALDAGADFAVVSALLGHSRSSLGTTGIYAAPSLDRQRTALDRGVARLLDLSEGVEAEVVLFPAR